MVELNTGNAAWRAEVIAKAFSDNGWGGSDYKSASTIAGVLAGGRPGCP
jgi:hypothetical protein